MYFPMKYWLLLDYEKLERYKKITIQHYLLYSILQGIFS